MIITFLIICCNLQEPNSLLDERHPLFQMGLTSSFSVETQRAALHFLAAACDKMELSRTVLLRILDVLLQSMTTTRETEKTINAMLRNKVREGGQLPGQTD